MTRTLARTLRLALVVFMIGTGAAIAVLPDEVLDDPALETRARALSQNLRCLVCQNQSIDDSDADLARDLRIIVRQRLVAGDTDDQVIQYVVDRYGDYVLLKPPVKWTTYALWYGPPAILAIAGAALLLAARQRRGRAETAGLSQDEERRLAALLDGDAEPR